MPRELSGLTLEQLDTAIVHYADALEEALEQGDDRKASLLLELTTALQSQEEQVIDRIVSGLVALDDQIGFAQQRADLYLAAKEKLEAAKAKIRVHIQTYIDQNLPEDNRKLQGKLFWIRTQTNSQDVVRVLDEARIPKTFFSIHGKLVLPASVRPEQLEALREFLVAYIPGASVDGLENAKPELNNDHVRLAAEAKLEVPGVVLERGRHLRHSKRKASVARQFPDAAKRLPQPAASA